MRVKYLFIGLLTVAFLIPAFDASAKILCAEISPKKVGQGDVFLIKVKNVRTSQIPSAVFEDNELSFSTCGDGCYVAIGAVEMKSKPGRRLIRLKVGKMKKNLWVNVKKVKFPVISLTLPEDKVILSPEDLERSKGEDKKLAELFHAVSVRLWDGDFAEPLDYEVITAFGAERIMNGKWTSIHKGIDIRGREGQEVRASNNGKVVLAEGLFFGGNTVILDHGQGIFTIYMHLSEMRANPGVLIAKGEVIGRVGSSGRATGPHLHFGAKVMNISVNPVSLTSLRL